MAQYTNKQENTPVLRRDHLKLTKMIDLAENDIKVIITIFHILKELS